MTKTHDKCSCSVKSRDAGVVRYYATQDMSEKMARTPEGFLICRDVAIARTGTQYYSDAEVKTVEARGGVVRIEREAEQVFRAETIASFEGKPVTNDHPDEDVTPDNWKQLAVGTVQNVRQGEGHQQNLLLADLLITDREAIDAVLDGKREVSCGYDTKLEQIEPGRGRQLNIVGNHVALVDRGRCGSSCSIKDHKKETTMTKPTVFERIKAAFTLKDEKALDEALKDAENEGTGNNKPIVINLNDKSSNADEIKALKDQIAKLEKARDEDEDEEEKKKKEKAEDEEAEEKEKEEKAKDAAALLDGDITILDTDTAKVKDAEVLYQDVKSKAEILHPGITLPKVKASVMRDSAKTRDALCLVKRHALSTAMTTDSGRTVIAHFMDGATIKDAPCTVIDSAFNGASALMKTQNNARSHASVKDSEKTLDAWKKGGIDKINQNFWNPQKTN